jgi:hypothetical protein
MLLILMKLESNIPRNIFYFLIEIVIFKAIRGANTEKE